MHENFIALDKEKRDRIINAAMHEFSAKGFNDASTNDIIKRAEISKGALFHYFSTKKDLFEFLYSYSIDFFAQSIDPYINNMPTDVFERWSGFTALKLEIAAQYPEMSDFMLNALRDDDKYVQDFLKGKLDVFYKDFFNKIYTDIDMSKFKPDIDVPKALQMIWWVLEGFAGLKQNDDTFDMTKLNDKDFMSALTREIDDYLILLKKSFYNEDYSQAAD